MEQCLYGQMKYLREHIMGEGMRNSSWLKREMKRIIPIAQKYDYKDLNLYLVFMDQLLTLKDNDMKRRVEIDQSACYILNKLNQEKQLLVKENQE